MGAAGFGGSFDPIVQYEKWEIHKVFPHFPYFRLGQNLTPNLLAPLCGVASEKFQKRIAKISLPCYNALCVRPKDDAPILGCRQAVRHQTLTLAFRRFKSGHPSQNLIR